METKKSTNFIGFHIPVEMDQWLRMYAVARNISVSQVLKELTEKWKDDNQITEEKLTAGILERIKTDHTILSLKTKVDKPEFLDKWRVILSMKLSKSLVNKIIKEYESFSSI